MRLAALACLGVLSIAGCASPSQDSGGRAPPCADVPMPTLSSFAEGPDRSKEVLWVNVTSSGRFDVAVPVPVSADGTRVAHWARNASAPAGWTVAAEGSGALRIQGSGSGSVATCSVQPARGGNGCCAEAYLDARWGAGDPRPSSIRVVVHSGTVGVEVDYQAGSNFCRAHAAFAGVSLRAGAQDVRGQAQAECT
jgi:hypothetical protein